MLSPERSLAPPEPAEGVRLSAWRPPIADSDRARHVRVMRALVAAGAGVVGLMLAAFLGVLTVKGLSALWPIPPVDPRSSRRRGSTLKRPPGPRRRLAAWRA